MAIYMKDKKSTYLQYNTMACLLNALVGEKTIIDLRNESSVHGQIVSADGYMNVEMEDCIFQNALGEFVPFETFFVSGRNVRYVHVPEGRSAYELMQTQLTQPSNKTMLKTKRTHKTVRSERYQREILNELKASAKKSTD